MYFWRDFVILQFDKKLVVDLMGFYSFLLAQNSLGKSTYEPIDPLGRRFSPVSMAGID